MKKKFTKKIKVYANKNPKQVENLLRKAYNQGLTFSWLGIKQITQKISKIFGSSFLNEDNLTELLGLLDIYLEENKPILSRPLEIAGKKIAQHSQKIIMDLGLEQAKEEIELPQDKSLEFITKQAELIKDLNEKTLNNIKKVCIIAHKESWNFTSLKEAFKEVAQISDKKAEFWARDQVIKINKELTNNIEKITKPLGYIHLHTRALTKYTRKEHLKRNGRFFIKGEIPLEDEPGVPYNCGCVKKLIYDYSMIPKKDRHKVKSS